MYKLQKDTTIKWKKDIDEISKGLTHIGETEIKNFSKIAEQHLPNIEGMKKKISHGIGYIEIRGLPIDQFISSPPKNGERPKNKDFTSEIALLGTTKALGLSPFSYQEEKSGALVHEIAPMISKNNSVSSLGRVDFSYHTDGAYLERQIRPHSLSLICLIDKARTGTMISPVSKAINLLKKDEIEILMSDFFEHIAPETFEVKNDKKISSVLDRVDGVYELKVALHSTTGINKSARKALESLTTAFQKTSYTKIWEPSDLVIFNNLRCVHGRGEIQGERWLQRCYGSFTLPTGKILNLKD